MLMVRVPLSPSWSQPLPSFLTSPCLGLLGGKVIGLPPVLNFGSPELKAKVPYMSRFLLFQVLISLGRSGSAFGEEVHLSCHFGGARG